MDTGERVRAGDPCEIDWRQGPIEPHNLINGLCGLADDGGRTPLARLLLVIEETWPASDVERLVFRLGDRPHLLLAPGIVVADGERFRPGTEVCLRRQDGSRLSRRIGGFVPTQYWRNDLWIEDNNIVAVGDLDVGDAPPGMEVWSVDRQTRRRV